MKIICSQSDLKSHLAIVSRVVPSRPTHPVLGNILIEATDDENELKRTGGNTVKLTGFDLSLGITTSFTADVKETGSLTVPAKLMNDIISRLPEGEIILVLNENENDVLLEIQSASGSFQVRGLVATEYPELPEIKDGETLFVPKNVLSEGLKGTAFAASDDDSKQVLTGVHFIGSQDTLEFAATDGHRLSVVKSSSLETEIQIEQVTIPAKALKEVEKMIAISEENDLSIKMDTNQIVFEIGSQKLLTRKLEGTYPAYQGLIPTEFKRKVVLDRKKLINALELVAVLSDSKNNIVKMSVDSEKEQIILSVDAKEIGKGQQFLTAEITGEDVNVGFNVKYLLEGLKAISSEEVQMQLNDSHQPVIFNPLGAVNMTYLVMPVQLRE